MICYKENVFKFYVPFLCLALETAILLVLTFSSLFFHLEYFILFLTLSVYLNFRWKLVEIDADLSNLTTETKHVMSLINPANTYMVQYCC